MTVVGFRFPGFTSARLCQLPDFIFLAFTSSRFCQLPDFVFSAFISARLYRWMTLPISNFGSCLYRLLIPVSYISFNAGNHTVVNHFPPILLYIFPALYGSNPYFSLFFRTLSSFHTVVSRFSLFSYVFFPCSIR